MSTRIFIIVVLKQYKMELGRVQGYTNPNTKQ